MKKIIIFLLTFAAIASLTVYGFAENRNGIEGETIETVITTNDLEETFTYIILEDQTIKIVDYDNNKHFGYKILEVPEELDGRPVSTIEYYGPAIPIVGFPVSSRQSQDAIFIPDTVTQIIGNPFVTISTYLFYVNVTHPTLAVIDGVLYSKPDKRLIAYPLNATSFSGIHHDDQEYHIPDGIKIIGSFSLNTDFKKLVIPDSVEEIEDYAFYGLHYWGDRYWGDTTISIPNGDIKLGCNPFWNCTVDNIRIDSERYVFEKKEKVLYDTKENRFICMLFESETPNYDIPEGIETIDDHAFSGCEFLERISIPASVTSIGSSTFQDCTRLREIIVDQGSYAEQYCKDLGLYYSYSNDDWLSN